MKKSMGWQPEQNNNALAYVFGLTGAAYQAILNIGLPVGFWSKFLESAITAGVCGFVGMAGKWLFELTKRSITEYFTNRKNKSQ